MKTIVLCRSEMTGTRFTGRYEMRDGCYREILEIIPEPKALVWLNQGAPSDCEKAERFAKQEGYRVLLFETSEPNPLGKARAALAKANQD